MDKPFATKFAESGPIWRFANTLTHRTWTRSPQHFFLKGHSGSGHGDTREAISSWGIRLCSSDTATAADKHITRNLIFGAIHHSINNWLFVVYLCAGFALFRFVKRL